MNSAMLMFDEYPGLETLSRAYKHLGVVDIQGESRIVTEGVWGWFAINIDDVIASECSDEEISEIKALTANPVFAQLEYSTFMAANLAISFLPATLNAWVDNDDGELRSTNAIRRLIQDGFEWQKSRNSDGIS